MCDTVTSSHQYLWLCLKALDHLQLGHVLIGVLNLSSHPLQLAQYLLSREPPRWCVTQALLHQLGQGVSLSSQLLVELVKISFPAFHLRSCKKLVRVTGVSIGAGQKVTRKYLRGGIQYIRAVIPPI